MRRHGSRRPAQDWLQRHWRWLAGAAVVAAVALLLLRQPLAELVWPRNPAQKAMVQADAALARGHLSAPDGSGARELYEAALAMDPDRPAPRQGLAEVARAALAQARRETAAGRYPAAHAALRLARELSAPRRETAQVAEELRRREAEGAGIEGLWAQAARAHANGRLHGDADAALPLYRRILQLDPDHLDALRGRDDAVAELLQQARAALRDGDLAAASAAIDVARTFDPGHAELPDTDARLTEERDATFARAEEDLEDGRLERAASAFQALLDIGPGDPAALDGLLRVGRAHARRAARLAGEFRFADAAEALALARFLATDDAEVRAAAERIESLRARHARTGPDRSPDDPEARAASARLLAAAAECFERELRANSLGRARGCLDARAALDEEPAALADARRRLAQRWLAIGDERLGAGDLDGARAALRSAREVDPSAAGLAEFEERLRTASGLQ